MAAYDFTDLLEAVWALSTRESCARGFGKSSSSGGRSLRSARRRGTRSMHATLSWTSKGGVSFCTTTVMSSTTAKSASVLTGGADRLARVIG